MSHLDCEHDMSEQLDRVELEHICPACLEARIAELKEELGLAIDLWEGLEPEQDNLETSDRLRALLKEDSKP